MVQPRTVVWFRNDLRLADNPALTAALNRGGQLLPVFIWAPEEEGDWPAGGASKWWLHQSLKTLDIKLRELGSRLIIRRGPTLETLLALAKETGASAVFCNRRYEPAPLSRDAKIKALLRGQGCEAEDFNATLLHEPWTISNQSGKPFRVFSPFWRHCLAKADPPEPLPSPVQLPLAVKWPKSLPLESLELEPRFDWAAGLRSAWTPGEAGAIANFQRFMAEGLEKYDQQRNRPDLEGTSRLSPHLHFGEISPSQIWHELRRSPAKLRSSQFVTELGWREFAHHQLFHFPQTPSEPLRAEFRNFEWRANRSWFEAWREGRTGFPMVDAGMRELWTTGWMHNRVRMVAASFLVKDLMQSWQEGARWFWDTLVDANLANNTLGWQWTAGCGADAAPYFRVFNPANQGEKFDPQGEYVRRWCPELAKLSNRWIHRPHQAPDKVLAAAGIVPGRSYPEPIVNHSIAREVALEAYARMKSRKAGCQ
jgi:deoxyribodipyrimidine photo-lyase